MTNVPTILEGVLITQAATAVGTSGTWEISVPPVQFAVNLKLF